MANPANVDRSRGWRCGAAAMLAVATLVACGSSDSGTAKPKQATACVTHKTLDAAQFVDPTLNTNPYHPTKPGATSAEEYLSTQQADGSWPDLRYTESDRDIWGPAVRHATRLLEMACIHHDKRARQEADERLVAGIRKGLRFWTDNDFLTSGWWANTIFIPREIGRTVLLMEPELPE